MRFAITDRDILDSILINDYADEEEETDEESNEVLPEEPKLLEIAYLIELLECRSLFDNSGGEKDNHDDDDDDDDDDGKLFLWYG